MEPSEDVCIYEVKTGDTLSSIAARFGYVTPTQLAKINRLSLFSGGIPPLFPGQKLMIPTAVRGSFNSIRPRIAPGSALRLCSVSPDGQNELGTDFARKFGFTTNPNFYATRTCVDQGSKGIEAESERQFVKVKAYRQLPSGDFVEGVLLITPDSLCFDALRTAIAQKEAYLEAHHSSYSSSLEIPETQPVNEACSITSSTNADTTSSEFKPFSNSALTIPKEFLELGLCVPLDLIASMSTLRSVPGSNIRECSPTDDEISSSRAGTNGCTSPYPDDFDNVTDAPNDVQTETGIGVIDANPNDIVQAPQLPLCSNRSRSVSSDPLSGGELSHIQTGKKIPRSESAVTQPLKYSMSNRLSAKSPHSPDFNEPSANVRDEPANKANASGDHLHLGEDEINHGSPPEELYLRLTQFPQNDEPPKEYMFRIATAEIPEVFAFLLRNGVGHSHVKNASNGSTSSIGAGYRPTTTSLRAMTSSIDSANSFPRRSLVEEALESMECASPLPVLYGGTSTILNEDMLEDLGASFPSHWIGCNLSLIYKTAQDGYSLNTLYRKSRHVQGGVLLVIRDTMGTVFGAIMSERMRCSKHFYGTGETCVFHWAPSFKRFDWTKKNDFFMRGSANSFHIGGQSGRNAIWFDEALKYGRSEPTDTFDNPVLSGTLPEFRMASLSLIDSVTTGEEHDNDSRPRSQTDPGSPSSPGVDSVPFIIDALELWELVS